MKKQLTILLMLLGLLAALTGCAGAPAATGTPFSGGSGTEADPYRISTPEDLQDLARLAGTRENQDTYASASYILTGDIDLGGKNWTPIGPDEVPFNGTLDGNGYTIRGLKLNAKAGSDGNAFGLVCKLEGTLRNLTIADSSIRVKGDSGYVGTFAGNCFGGTIENCHTTDTVEVTAEFQAGGICGSANKDSTLRGCTNSAQVSATGTVGGAGGIAYYVRCAVSDCINNGAITSKGDAAGIAVSSSTVTDCVNNGTVSARSYAAGITCRFSDGALNDSMNDTSVALLGCVNNASVTSLEDPAGGIAVSCRTGQVVNCANNGAVTSPAEAGGIFAYYQPGAFGTVCPEFTVSGCRNSGNITALDSFAAGGICGEVYGGSTRIVFTDCQNTGTIQATGKTDTLGSGSEAGGIVGCANVVDLDISGSTNSGTILGFAYAGGIVGRAYPDNYVENVETSFRIAGCSNQGPIHTAEPGGTKKDIYVGGIVGHCRVIDGDDSLLLAFDRILEEGCENTGSLSGDQEKARLHTGSIFGNQEEFVN